VFVDLSFFEVAEGHEERYERAFAVVVTEAGGTPGCLSSELVRLSEERRYCWVERWESREAHLTFNEFLFGELLPGIPELNNIVTRLVERDAEGTVVR
jgi:Antibiotic biosynthesis monooxygenase